MAEQVTVISGDRGWHIRDLQRAAAELGVQLKWHDFRDVRAEVPSRQPGNAARQRLLVRTLPAGSLEQVVFRLTWLHCWQASGEVVCNTPAALEACVDKFATSWRLANAGVATPATRVSQTARQALADFHDLGGDVVVKPLFGSEGRGQMRISDPDLMWRTAVTLERLQAVLYLQRFIHHPGWDVRVLVLGGRVLGAMRRVAKTGHWRTNVAQGAAAEPWPMDDRLARLSLAAANTVGADFAGVDLLCDEQGGWQVLEVNGVPGWRAFAPVTGIDVARCLLEYLVSR
jgi:ribosomal protein S6--L-glutamate ligase